MYKSLEEQGGVNTAIRIATCRKKRSEDVSQSRCIKNNDGEVRWKEYFEELLIVENDRIQRSVRQSAVADVRDISPIPPNIFSSNLDELVNRSW